MAASLFFSKEALKNQGFFPRSSRYIGQKKIYVSSHPSIHASPQHWSAAVTGMAQCRASPSQQRYPYGARTVLYGWQVARTELRWAQSLPCASAQANDVARKTPGMEGLQRVRRGWVFSVAAFLDQNCAPTLLESKGS